MRSQLGTAPVDFPIEEPCAVANSSSTAEETPEEPLKEHFPSTQPNQLAHIELVPAMPTPVQTPTAETSEAPSETGSTDPTTPSPAVTPQPVKSLPSSTPQLRHTRAVVPVVPAVPVLPLSPKTLRHAHRDSVSVVSSTSQTAQLESSSDQERRSSTTSVPATSEISPVISAGPSKPASSPAPPKSWADLVRSKAPPKPASTTGAVSQIVNGLGPAKNETLSDVLNTMDVTATPSAAKIAFLKPRGLLNTGNMCYMNSVCTTFPLSSRKKLTITGVASFGFLYSVLRIS